LLFHALQFCNRIFSRAVTNLKFTGNIKLNFTNTLSYA